MNNEEELKKIVEQIKSGLPLEVLDELEKEYNQMYQKLKTEHSSSIEKKD